MKEIKKIKNEKATKEVKKKIIFGTTAMLHHLVFLKSESCRKVFLFTYYRDDKFTHRLFLWSSLIY